MIGLALGLFTGAASGETWPELPTQDASVRIPAQEWPYRPGPRTVEVWVYYPGRSLDKVGPQTGIMLSLHNWGGTHATGTADPRTLADRLNVVALCVDYLQSGRKEGVEGPEPYDCGYLQALDALRAVHFVYAGLKARNQPFAAGRIYATGGSGGGNVALMANKLAPRTFACIVPMCGLAKLNDDIAYGLPGGSSVNARYNQDPQSPHYLTPDAQALRFVGHPSHLQVMRALKTTCKIVVVHGVDDTQCPFADGREMVENMRQAGLDVEAHFIAKTDLDGKVFTSSGHPLGNRTLIVFKVAEKYLLPDSPDALVRRSPPDFDLRDAAVRYPTPNGCFVISYEAGYPVGRFEAKESAR